MIDAMDHGLPMTKAVTLAGIHYSTWRSWVEAAEDAWSRGVENEYTNFVGEVRFHEAQFAQSQIDTVVAHGKRSWTAAAWILERRFPQEFGPRQAVEVSGPDGGAVQIQDSVLVGLTTDELLAVQSALAKLRGMRDGTNHSALTSGQTVDVVPTNGVSHPSPAGGDDSENVGRTL